MKHQTFLAMVAGAALLFGASASYGASTTGHPGAAPSASAPGASAPGASTSGGGGGINSIDAVLVPIGRLPPAHIRPDPAQFAGRNGCAWEAKQYDLYGYNLDMFMRACVNQKAVVE
ncbi:hypothetical protein [Methylocapsa sp. S129]|uniref:hypothetical protein n=1 Tax=Methylocapsa sp. S129 TaxID=1641869 RepID=UPI00131E132A|nr:hypothetical protein [Methylocapsa sp. S129]